MIVLEQAFRQVINSPTKTSLTALAMTVVLLSILTTNSLINGMLSQAVTARIQGEVAQGQIHQGDFDPTEMLNLESAHAPLSDTIWNSHDLEPVLVASASAYPKRRLYQALLQGIRPHQSTLNIDFSSLGPINENDQIPVVMGTRMAQSLGLALDESFMLRWRSSEGYYNATEAILVDVFQTDSAASDIGRIWMDLTLLNQLLDLKQEASMLLIKNTENLTPLLEDVSLQNWHYKTQFALLHETYKTIEMRKNISYLFIALLLFLTLISVFDTQSISIVNRAQEIGIMMALGLTSGKIIAIFVVESLIHGLISLIASLIIGIPLVLYFSKHGIPLPADLSNYGISVGSRLYLNLDISSFSLQILVIVCLLALCAYLPSGQIARLSPIHALKGKINA